MNTPLQSNFALRSEFVDELLQRANSTNGGSQSIIDVFRILSPQQKYTSLVTNQSCTCNDDFIKELASFLINSSEEMNRSACQDHLEYVGKLQQIHTAMQNDPSCEQALSITQIWMGLANTKINETVTWLCSQQTSSKNVQTGDYPKHTPFTPLPQPLSKQEIQTEKQRIEIQLSETAESRFNRAQILFQDIANRNPAEVTEKFLEESMKEWIYIEVLYLTLYTLERVSLLSGDPRKKTETVCCFFRDHVLRTLNDLPKKAVFSILEQHPILQRGVYREAVGLRARQPGC